MFKTMSRVAVAAALLCVVPFAAGQTTYSVFVDTDLSATSGCEVTYPGGVVRGAEVRFDIPVALGAAPQVGRVRQSACSAGSFVPGPLIGNPYVAGINNGVSGSDVIEMQVPLSALPPIASGSVRLSIAAEAAGASDVLLTRTGAAGGGPIFLSSLVTFIPTTGALGLVLLGAVVLLVGLRQARRRLRVLLAGGLLLVSGVVLATSFVVDGQVSDWTGATPLATDPAGDPTNASVALDLRALFGVIDEGTLTVRVDVADLQNRQPVANAQTVTLLEDAAATTITLTGSDPEGAALAFILGTAPTRGTLGALTPTGPTSASLTYSPTANANGADSFTFRVSDGAVTSPDATVSITVTPVNDAPAFTASTPPTILEDAGAQTIANWASFNPGPPDEASQTATYTVSAISNAALFSSAPAVAPDGTLSYTPAANANGSSSFTVTVRDSGGTANGGVDSSAPQTFTITVTAVNDAPVFTAGPNQTVDEDAGVQTVNPWATAISAGPPDEAAQTLAFNVTGNTNAALFSAAPAVAANGTLTYTPAANANGSATITLTLADSGPNTPPNQNTSAAQTFTINVNAVNDAPFNTVPGAQTTGDTIPLVLSTANANAISVADVDAGTGLVQMRFATGDAANGTLSLANPGGGLSTLTGNGTATVVATGTIAALNAALNGPSGGLTYTPVVGTAAARTITVTTDDQGNTGSGGAGIDTDTITVNVDAAPVVSSSPVNGATIAENAAIAVNFSEPVNVLAGVTLGCTGGTVSGLGGTTGSNVTTLNLSYAGVLGGTCTLTVPAASVSDVDTIDPPNNPAGDYVASFTVDAAPTVTSTSPANGGTAASNAALQVEFSELVDISSAAVFSLECGGLPMGYTVTSPAVLPASTSNVTLVPAGGLPEGQNCIFTVFASAVPDSDAIDPPDTLPADVVVNFTVDAAPAFVSSVPATDGGVVGSGQAVSFTFSENVDDLGNAITLNCGGPVAGTISGGGTPTLSFTPTTPITAGASCTATAVAGQIGDTDAFDPPQNPVANVVRTFTVDGAPTILTVTPANGAVNVGLSDNITVVFSEPVNFAAGAFSLECPGGNAIPFTVSGSGTATATIDPGVATLPINTLCVFTANAALVTDVDAADPPDTGTGVTSVSFTTVNDNAPTVTTNPSGGGDNIAVNANITVTFDEPVSLTGAWFRLACAVSGARTSTGELTGTGITIIENTPDLVYTIDPSVDLASGESCEITIDSASVVDNDAIDPPNELDGNASGDTIDGDADDYVAVFTTRDVAPTVTSLPANGATVPNNQVVTLNFSEQVNVAAGAITFLCDATPVAFTPTLPQSNVDTLVLTPASALPSGACTVTLESTLITDGDAVDPPDQLDGNASGDVLDGDADDFVLNFTVDAPPAPQVVTVEVGGVPTFLPLGAGVLADVGTNIGVSLSENIDATAAGATLECPVGVPVAFAGLPVTNTTTITLNPVANLPGDTVCELTLLPAGIVDSDTIDPPNRLDGNGDGVEGDLASFSFRTQTVANDDAAIITPHLTYASPTSVRANDQPPTATVTGFGPTLATANGTVPNGSNFITAGGAGGRVVLNADGTFVFYPDAGDDNIDGAATFFYTVAGGDTAQVTLSFEAEQLVWFADSSPPGPTVCTGTNSGTQACPASDIVTLIGPSLTASDILFIDSGSYQCGITLPTSVQVIGNGSSSTLTALAAAHTSPITPVVGSSFAPYNALNGVAPVLDSPAGDCFTLGQGNTVRGLTVGNTPNGHAFQDGGGTIGTATIVEVGFTGTGGIFNLANGGTLNAALGGLNSTSSPSAPILLTNIAGTITQTGGGTITHSGNFDLFDVNGGSVGVALSAALVATGGNGSVVDVSGGHTGALTFTGGVSTAAPYSGDNLQLDNADGSYTFSGVTDLLAGIAGVNVQNGSGGSLVISNAGSSIANITGSSFRVNSSSMTVSTAMDIVHAAQASRGIEVIGGTGTLQFNGPLQIGTVAAPMLSAEGVFLDDTGATNAITFADLRIITGTGGGAGSQAFVSQTSGRIAVTTGSIDCNGNIGTDNQCFDVSNTTSTGVTFASFLADHDDGGENGGGIFLSNTPGSFTFSNVTRMTGNNAAIVQASNFGALNIGTAGTGNMETSNRPVWNIENGSININATVLRSTNSTTQGLRLVNVGGTGVSTTGAITIDLAPASGVGIVLENITAGTYSFSPASTVNVIERPSNGIRIAGSAGTIGFGNTTINSTAVGAPAIRIDASSSVVSFAQTNIDMGGAGGNENFLIGAGPSADAYTPRDNGGDGDAVYVTGLTGSLAINGGTITRPGDDGIDIRNSRNLTLANMSFVEAGRSPSAGCVDCNSSGVQAFALTGTNSVSNSSFLRGRLRNFYISNPSGTTTLNISGSTFDDTRGQGSPATDNLQIYTSGTAAAAFNVSNSTFLRSATHQINAVAKDTSTITELDITGITMRNDGGPSSGVRIDGEGASSIAFNLIGNPVLYAQDENVVTVSTAGTAQMQGRIQNNADMRFTTASAGGSIFGLVRALSDGTMSRVTLDVSGNTMRLDNGTNGIAANVQAFDAARVDIRVANNTLDAMGTPGIPFDAISGDVNNQLNAGTAKVLCGTFSGNTVTGNWLRAARLRSLSPTGIYITGYAGSFATTWANQGNNSGALPVAESVSGGAVISAPPAPCSTPSHPLP